MRICKPYKFPGNIQGFHLGWAPVGPPMMMVYIFVLGDLMVDTGQAHMGKEALDIAQSQKVRRIYLTHHHEDHSGNAARICRETGAGIFGHDLTRKKMAASYRILPYQKYVWGGSTPVEIDPFPEVIHTDLGPMVPIHTPGHSRDHTAYFLPDQGIVFSGDLYLGDRIKFFRSDEDLGDEVASLKKIAKLDFDSLLCSHNPKSKRGKDHILAKLDFLETLYDAVVDLHLKGWGEKEIFSRLRLKEDHFTKWFCFGNVSMMNGVRSAVRHYESVRSG